MRIKKTWIIWKNKTISIRLVLNYCSIGTALIAIANGRADGWRKSPKRGLSVNQPAEDWTHSLLNELNWCNPDVMSGSRSASEDKAISDWFCSSQYKMDSLVKETVIHHHKSGLTSQKQRARSSKFLIRPN